MLEQPYHELPYDQKQEEIEAPNKSIFIKIWLYPSMQTLSYFALTGEYSPSTWL